MALSRFEPPLVCRSHQSKFGWRLSKGITEQTDFRLGRGRAWFLVALQRVSQFARRFGRVDALLIGHRADIHVDQDSLALVETEQGLPPFKTVKARDTVILGPSR